jgi:hypothetical protein
MALEIYHAASEPPVTVEVVGDTGLEPVTSCMSSVPV